MHSRLPTAFIVAELFSDAIPASAGPGNLVEVIACEGGCVNGPAIYNNPRKTTAAVKRFAGQQ